MKTTIYTKKIEEARRKRIELQTGDHLSNMNWIRALEREETLEEADGKFRKFLEKVEKEIDEWQLKADYDLKKEIQRLAEGEKG